MKEATGQMVYLDKHALRQTIRIAKKNRTRLNRNKGKFHSASKIGRALAVTGAVIVTAAFVFGLLHQPNATQLSAVLGSGAYAEGVVVEGVDISGLSYDDALASLQITEQIKLQTTDISFQFNGETYTKTAEALGITTDIDEVLKKALMADKTEVFLFNLKTKFTIKQSGAFYETAFTANADTVSQAIALFEGEFDTDAIEPVMVFDENDTSGIYITWQEGRDGIALDGEDLLNKILANIPKGNLELGTVASITTAPNDTAEALSNKVVKIAEYTTSFYGVTLSEEKRVANIVKMADLINGSVIEPGKTWSFNDGSGERNLDSGWQLAKTLYGGVLVEEMGGGVCQVSSTVYNAFLLSEVGIIERHAHSRPSSYVPNGLDATVDYGAKDLVIQNTLEDTIYLVVKVDEQKKTITAMVYGPKPNHDYQVIVRALIWQSNIEPDEPAKTIVAEGGFAPDGTYVAPGATYAYPKTTLGSRYKTYRYYYPLEYDDDKDNPYSWVGYVQGDNTSGEKLSVTYYTEDGSGKDIITYYPPLPGTYYINPKDAE